jgi:hypothetical protein
MDRTVVLQESRAWFDDIPIGMSDLGGFQPSKHYVEFGEAKNECVRLVNEHNIDGFAEGVGKDRCQFETAKARAQHYHPRMHAE